MQQFNIDILIFDIVSVSSIFLHFSVIFGLASCALCWCFLSRCLYRMKTDKVKDSSSVLTPARVEEAQLDAKLQPTDERLH